MRHVWQLIQEDPGKHCPLPLLAKAARLNEFALKRTFQAVFGITIYQKLLCIRLEHAKKEIALSEKSITEIAAECGYGNAEYFTNWFRKKVGMPPTIFRKKFTR